MEGRGKRWWAQITQPQWGLKSWTKPVWGRNNIITTQPAALVWNATTTLNDMRTAFTYITFDTIIICPFHGDGTNSLK